LTTTAIRARRCAFPAAASAGRGAFAALCFLAAACATAPPAAPPLQAPEAAPVVLEAVPPAPPPPVYVRVTGSRLNVRESPSTKARTIAKVARGSRLARLSEQGEWLEVEMADGSRGWVHGSYVRREPECQPDSREPALLSDPVVGFVEGARRGTIVMEATVAKSGEVVAVETKENSTGSVEQEAMVAEELKRLRFAPFIRNCRPVSFIYVYTRSF
jgi:uncharacterized protein YgiM (DUF1202 family)